MDINKQHKKWQQEWRQILGKPKDVDIEPDCDFELHFDIWHADKNDFFKLFENFPRGSIIAERAYRLRWGDLKDLEKKLTYQELIVETKKAIDILQQLQPSDELINPNISIKKGDHKLRLDLLSESDAVSIEVDNELSALVKKSTGELGYQAYHFLIEPLYRLSSSYIPVYWILWCLTDDQKINPYTPLLKLFYNQCDVALTDQGVLIFKTE